jgi:hypothetical protein
MNQKNILITDYRGENVMVFTSVPLNKIKEKLDKKGENYSDIFEVKDDDLQYYIYEPLHLDEKTEKLLIA